MRSANSTVLAAALVFSFQLQAESVLGEIALEKDVPRDAADLVKSWARAAGKEASIAPNSSQARILPFNAFRGRVTRGALDAILTVNGIQLNGDPLSSVGTGILLNGTSAPSREVHTAVFEVPEPLAQMLVNTWLRPIDDRRLMWPIAAVEVSRTLLIVGGERSQVRLLANMLECLNTPDRLIFALSRDESEAALERARQLFGDSSVVGGTELIWETVPRSVRLKWCPKVGNHGIYVSMERECAQRLREEHLIPKVALLDMASQGEGRDSRTR